MARHEKGKHKGGDGSTGKKSQPRQNTNTKPFEKPTKTVKEEKPVPPKETIHKDILRRGD